MEFIRSLLEFDKSASEKEEAGNWITLHRDFVNDVAKELRQCSGSKSQVSRDELLGDLLQKLGKEGLEPHAAEAVANELLNRYAPLEKSDYVHNISTPWSSPFYT